MRTKNLNPVQQRICYQAEYSTLVPDLLDVIRDLDRQLTETKGQLRNLEDLRAEHTQQAHRLLNETYR